MSSNPKVFTGAALTAQAGNAANRKTQGNSGILLDIQYPLAGKALDNLSCQFSSSCPVSSRREISRVQFNLRFTSVFLQDNSHDWTPLHRGRAIGRRQDNPGAYA